MNNAATWMLWLAATMTFLLSTRNPLYLSITINALFLLGYQQSRRKNISAWVLPNLRFLLTMTLLSTLINMLFSHIGGTVLFTIPQDWPLIGGNITLESMVYGVINGLVIGAIYLLFNVINLALNIKQITHLIPRAFHPVAMMVTITLTFFPSIQQRAREIKEAQMIRGNPMKKIVDWIPILIPLLVTSLEKAILLAESMTARGFQKQTDLRSPTTLISLILAAFSIFSGWILQLYQYPTILSMSLYMFGGGITVVTLTSFGKRTKVTRYHREVWHRAEVILFTFFAFYILSFATLALGNHLTSLSYSPYPRLAWPTFQTIGVILSLVPLLPFLVLNHD